MAKTDVLIRSKKKKALELLIKGELQAAKSLYQQISKKACLDAEVWANLSVINRSLGLRTEATECSAQAVKINSLSPEISFIHACSLQGQGLLEESIEYYKIVVQLKPEHADSYYQLGNVYRTMGELENSEKNYLMAIQYKPDFLEAMSNLGALFVSGGRKKEAEIILNKANEIRPDCEQVLCNLGNLYLSSGQEDKAIDYAKRVIKLNPVFSDAHFLLGKAYRLKGMFDDALACYEQVMRIVPSNQEVIAAIAEIHELRSNYETAFELINPLIEKGEAHPSVLLVFAALSRHFNLQKKSIYLLEESLAQARGGFSFDVDMHGSLGLLYDKSGMYDKAFEHYTIFNKGLSSAASFGDSEKENPHIQILNTMVDKSTEVDFWKSLSRSSNSSELPVFVIGMPRSGTTLIEQILSSHPEIHGAGELTEIGNIAQLLARKTGLQCKYPQCLEKVTTSMLDEMTDHYLKLIAKEENSALRVVDKMPDNFLHLGLISILFPYAKIIHIRRNPVDTCLSMYFQKFGPTMEYTTDLSSLGNYYNQYKQLMNNWRSTIKLQMLEVNYEDLISRQEDVSREMIEFTGLDWNENCLSFHKSKRDVNTPSYHQVRQPIYTKSVERWRNYERHLGALITALDMRGSG